jgi:hypothetical protein
MVNARECSRRDNRPDDECACHKVVALLLLHAALHNVAKSVQHRNEGEHEKNKSATARHRAQPGDAEANCQPSAARQESKQEIVPALEISARIRREEIAQLEVQKGKQGNKQRHTGGIRSERVRSRPSADQPRNCPIRSRLHHVSGAQPGKELYPTARLECTCPACFPFYSGIVPPPPIRAGWWAHDFTL